MAVSRKLLSQEISNLDVWLGSKNVSVVHSIPVACCFYVITFTNLSFKNLFVYLFIYLFIYLFDYLLIYLFILFLFLLALERKSIAEEFL